MDSTVVIVAAITATPVTIVGIATLISALRNNVKKDIKEIKEDIAVTKEASFYSLQAHVENGSNGDVKKSYERLRGNIFKD